MLLYGIHVCAGENVAGTMETREGKSQKELGWGVDGAQGTDRVPEGQKPKPLRVSRDVTVIIIH